MSGKAVTIRSWRDDIPGKLSDDKMAFVLPQVMSQNIRGKETTWQVRVELFKNGVAVPIEDNHFNNTAMDPAYTALITVDSGLRDGKIRKVVPTPVPRGKNIGRANATNVFCQALRDALGMHNKQLRKAATNAAPVNTPLYPPMLAKRIQDQPIDWNINKEVYVQRKYNGVRCVAALDLENGTPKVITYSRRRLTYPGFQYIKNELLPVLKTFSDAGRNIYLDGEMYMHGMALQSISGYARRANKPDDTKINYVLFDCFIPSAPDLVFSDRLVILQRIFKEFPDLKWTIPCETNVATSDAALGQLYRAALSDGYEGIMVRLNSVYVYSYNEHHANVLLKFKPTMDAEYPIVGWETGRKGKAAEALMIICALAEDKSKTFPVTPAMTLQERNDLATKMGQVESNGKTHFENVYLGQMLIVYFDEVSLGGIPQRARTKMELRTWD